MRKIIFPFCKLSKCFFPWFPWHCRNQFFRTEGAEDSHRAALSALCALVGCHGNLPPFSSRRPHILLQTLFRCSTNNLWFYLFAFHLRISQQGVLVLCDLDPHRYFRPHGLCSCHLCLRPFSLVPDMIANDNFICIFVNFFWLKILVSVFWSKQNHFRLKTNH